jgi:hypothetical protein
VTRRSDGRPVDERVLEVVVPFAFMDDTGTPVVIAEGERVSADSELLERFPLEWFRPLRLRSP